MAQGERITDDRFIADLLRRIMENRALLTITLPGVAGTYHSAILRLDPEQGYLLLDELHPPYGHSKLIETGKLNARATVKGVEIRFPAALQEVGTESGISLYRTNIPDEVFYRQRRAHFRVNVSAAAPMEVSLELPGGGSLSGRIVDISEGGIGVELPVDVPLNQGERLQCRMTLPKNTQFGCKLEVRHLGPARSGDKTHMGALFLDLPNHRRKVLARVIADIQRAMIRTLPRDEV